MHCLSETDFDINVTNQRLLAQNLSISFPLVSIAGCKKNKKICALLLGNCGSGTVKQAHAGG